MEGKTVKVSKDRGDGEVTVTIIKPYNGNDIRFDEIAWECLTEKGETVYVIEGAYPEKGLFGGIDPFIGE